jgi:hypothetical protein
MQPLVLDLLLQLCAMSMLSQVFLQPSPRPQAKKWEMIILNVLAA